MNDRNDRTEEIPTFRQDSNAPDHNRQPEEPHRSVNWSHIAILLGIIAGIVIVALIAIINIRSDLNAADATASETPSATPKETEATDFYTGDDESTPTPSPSATAGTKKKTDADKKDSDKDDDDDDDDDSDTDVPSDIPLVKTFDNINLNNGISVSARASSGTLEAIATDADGNSTVIFKEDGSFDKSDVRTDLPSGSYTITVYSNASGWSWSYNSY